VSNRRCDHDPYGSAAHTRSNYSAGDGSIVRRIVAFVFWISWAVAWTFDAHARLPSSRELEATITEVRVDLTIHRGGAPLASGKRVSPGRAQVEGTAVYRLAHPARRGEVLHLLDFAAFMASEPRDLDEVALATYVAGPFDAAKMEITGVWGGDAVRRVGPRRDVVVPLHEGATEVILRYVVSVPRRYWPLGCAGGRCSLSGAVAPLPSLPARGGDWLPSDDRVIAPVRWIVERARFGIRGDRRPGGTAISARKDPADELVVIGGRGELAPYPSILWGRAWHRTERDFRGVKVTVLHVHPRPGAQFPDETAVQLRRDLVGHVLQTVDEIADLALGAGARAHGEIGLTVIQGPLRSELAQVHPGLVVVSDQAMEVLPAERLLKFHQEAIARALAEALVEQRVRGRQDASVGLWLPGQLALAILTQWRALREHRDEYAHDLLRNLTFVPNVDQFLYTQQASFSQSYFRGVEDDYPLRNHPLWFSHALPTGRRIHEKLVDTLSAAELGDLYVCLLADPGLDPQVAAERAYGHTLAWFFSQWLGPYPAVDYAITSVRTEPSGTGFHHEIEIERRGERPLIEPVALLVEERGGARHFLAWNGELSPGLPAEEQPAVGRHRFELETRKKIRTVTLDPRQRLVEQALPPHDNDDPLFNDRRPAAFRFLYTGASLSIAASEFANATTVADRLNAISLYLAFEASLRRDLRRTGHLTIARDRESHLALGVATNLWFGAKVNSQRRRARVRLAASGSWLSTRSLDPTGGVRMIEQVSLIDDTRRFGWWPERGHRLSLSVAARQVLRTDGATDHRFDVWAEAEWMQLWRLAQGHVIATLIATSITVPIASEPEFRGLNRVGGIGGLSGYLADEVFGLGVLHALLEYRHALVWNMDLNLLHLLRVRGIGGAAFVGAASSSSCEAFAGWLGAKSWYAHAGYGLTAQLALLGIVPQLLRVEVAVPLVRRPGRGCLGETFPDFLAQRQSVESASVVLPDFNVNVLFNQPF